jgi:two-component system, LytTR family, sensor kinase
MQAHVSLPSGSRLRPHVHSSQMNPIEPKLVLISLLIQLGVAAAVSSSLARSVTFRRLLLGGDRTLPENLQLVAFLCFPLALGVWIRAIVPNFLAADISLGTVILLGLIAGPSPACVGALALSAPAVLHREYLSLPVNVGAAMVAGSFYRFVDVESIWAFSPMIDLSLYRWVRRNLRRPHLDRQVLLLVTIAVVQLAASEVSRYYPRRYFALRSPNLLLQLAICATAPVLVGIPLKIWNAIRIED